MPLSEMSTNIQEPESTGRKRSHDEFSDEAMKMDWTQENKTPEAAIIQPSEDNLLHAVPHNPRNSSPRGSPALTEAGSSTASRNSPSPPTPSKDKSQPQSSNQPSTASATASAQPASAMNSLVKRKRTTAEKEARDKELADKKREREQKAVEKAAEKAKQEEEKAARAKEREEKRKKKEEEDRVKAEKKRKKEEEQQRIQEEKDRKARSQKTLGSFFTSAPKKAEGEALAKDKSPTKAGPAASAKQAGSEYAKLFKPFFVKGNTRLAPATVRMDEETREAKSRILDNHIANQEHELRPFDPMDIFALPFKPHRRGKLYEPVKHIMEMAYKENQSPGKTGGADANKAFTEVRKQLAKVPMKVIAFSQDVRPPYYGTITFKPFALGQGNMQKLARRSTGRRLPLDYDYDSEAEWQEEEGEDLDVEDEEEELDDEDDMDGFLDDSEDIGVSRRVFGNTMEPESTGICFENPSRQGPNPAVYESKMEFIHGGLEQQWGIDPFSTKYWEPEPKVTKSKAPKAVKSESEAKMPPPPAPTNAFAALDGGSGSNAGSAKLVKAELMNDVKQAILDNKALSKVGIIDFIFHQFRDSVSRAEVKNTIEFVAEKKGAGRSKEWELKPGHEIVM